MNAIHQCAPEAPVCGNARLAKAVRGFLALTVALTMLALPALTTRNPTATNHSREQVAGSKPSAAGGSAIAGINNATGNVQPPLSL